MSYLSFLQNNDINNINKNHDTSERIDGTCRAMCPQEEIQLRQKETLVHVLEVWGPMKKLVKSYSRSAADSQMAVPRMLRPYTTLMDTTEHLVLEVTKRTDVPTSVVYNFVDDRLRAVRQDMTIQRLPPEHCAHLLEPMVRFYVYYGYRLCELPLKDYDPVLNQKQLLQCIKWCLTCFDAMDRDSSRIDGLTHVLSSVKLDNRGKIQCDRVLVESLYLLCNLGDVHPVLRYISLPKHLKSEPTLKRAYHIAVANIKRNYVLVCNLMDALCPLAYCAVFLHLPVIQRQALTIMSHAYNNKRLTVPCDALRRWLHFATDNDVRTTCKHYGIAVEGRDVRFDKGEIKVSVGLHSCTKTFTSERLNLDVDHLFTYTS